MAYTYFSADYFSTDYWGGDYFGTDGAVDGILVSTIYPVRIRATGQGYWSSNYWSISYWSNNYWTDAYLEPYLTGTYRNNLSYEGTISKTLEAFTSEIPGSAIQVENFDLSVVVGVPWQISAYDVFTGTVSNTLADATLVAAGYTTGADSSIGTISVTLADSTADFDGTYVAPAKRTGIIPITMARFVSTIRGEALEPETIFGVVSPTLDTMEFSGSGTLFLASSEGSISANLADFEPTIAGNAYPVEVTVGYLNKRLANFSLAARGSNTGGRRALESVKGDAKGQIRVPSSRGNRVGPSRKMRA